MFRINKAEFTPKAIMGEFETLDELNVETILNKILKEKKYIPTCLNPKQVTADQLLTSDMNLFVPLAKHQYQVYVFYSKIEKLYCVLCANISSGKCVCFNKDKKVLFNKFRGTVSFTKELKEDLSIYCMNFKYRFSAASIKNKDSEYYAKNLHRDGVAYMSIIKEGSCGFVWAKNGIPHRDKGPQTVIIQKNYWDKNFCEIEYTRDGKMVDDGITFMYLAPYGLTTAFFRGKSIVGTPYSGMIYNDYDHTHKLLKQTITTIDLSKKSIKNNFNGPYKTIETPKIIKKEWYINNKRLDRRRYPYIENGELYGPKLTAKVKINTLLFDREYYQFIMKVAKKQNS